MPDFSRIISLAYLRILDRPPDAGGLAAYNDAMNAGLTEAMMRESLLRSPEYAQKNPDRPAARGAAASRRGGAASSSGTSTPRRRQPARRR